MTFNEIKAMSDKFHMPTYSRYPVALESGHGAVIQDVDEKKYLDFGSGIGVSALGQTDSDWVEAVQKQTAKLAHVSNLYYNESQAKLAKMLCKATGMTNVFFINSGAEANECAIKTARKYSFDKYGEGRSTVLCLNNSFHGRTMATLAATGQDSFHQYFFPFPDGFAFVDAGNMEALYAVLDDTVCAIMVECVQGEGGVVPLEADYLAAVRSLCDARDILLICDEVQTGVGRTGSFLACTGLGVMPDIATLAKGIGGGLPMSACLTGGKLDGVMTYSTHGSTFGGNPIVCAGAAVVVEKLTADGFMDSVIEKGYRLRAGLKDMPGVKEIRGRGLMLGIVLEDGIESRDVVEACLEQGLLVLTAKTLVRLLPPLTISEEEIDDGLAIIGAVLKKMEKAGV